MTYGGFPKLGDPTLAPEIVGSLLYRPQNKVPFVFGISHIVICYNRREPVKGLIIYCRLRQTDVDGFGVLSFGVAGEGARGRCG